jgi:hypothetical protein
LNTRNIWIPETFGIPETFRPFRMPKENSRWHSNGSKPLKTSSEIKLDGPGIQLQNHSNIGTLKGPYLNG